MTTCRRRGNDDREVEAGRGLRVPGGHQGAVVRVVSRALATISRTSRISVGT